MVKISLDTNCFINACRIESHAHQAVKQILDLRDKDVIAIFVSLQTLSELEARKDDAYELAISFEVLPYYSIGTWKEQIGSWKQEAGTWQDGKDDDETQKRIKTLAKAGNDIRDRGAYIDAIRAKLYAFITSDNQLVGNGPAKRLNEVFDTKVLSPQQLLEEICLIHQLDKN